MIDRGSGSVPSQAQTLSRRLGRRLELSPFFVVQEAVVVREDGTDELWHYHDHPGAAVIVCVDADGSVLLLDEWRTALGDFCLNLPGGRVDAGEDALTAAKREFHEETGYRAADWRSLGAVLPSPGSSNERVEVFLARQLEIDDAATPEGMLTWVTREAATRLALSGKDVDALTVVGILRAQRVATEERAGS